MAALAVACDAANIRSVQCQLDVFLLGEITSISFPPFKFETKPIFLRPQLFLFCFLKKGSPTSTHSVLFYLLRVCKAGKSTLQGTASHVIADANQ